jgi:DNA-binding GntR family transcriptional regulator
MENIVKTSLSEQIYSILREDIINQNIKFGEKLTIKALQDRFGISSTPIREALNRLGQDGLIDHVTNVGAWVVDIKEKDIIEIYDFCSLLDSTALKNAVMGTNLNELQFKLNDCIKLQEQSLESENIKEFKVHSDNFHDIFFKFADNKRLYDASLKIRSQLSILTNKYQNFAVAKSVVLIEHKNIVEAIEKKDIDMALVLMANHFEHAKSYLLQNIKGNIQQD